MAGCTRVVVVVATPTPTASDTPGPLAHSVESTPTSPSTPTPTATPTPTPRPIPTPTPIPTPRPTPTPGPRLQQQLPRHVYEGFYRAFYEGCRIPAFESLRVLQQWTGNQNKRIEFRPPEGSWFLAVVGAPQATFWSFTALVESPGGQKYQVLTINNSAGDTNNAHMWCSTGRSIIPYLLETQPVNVVRTVFLVAPGAGDPLPRSVATALQGFYGDCPEKPSIYQLHASILATSRSAVQGTMTIPFDVRPPFYFLAVDFDPQQSTWHFRSIDSSANWRSLGPSVSSADGRRMDFSAVCPQSPSPHRLEVDWSGGQWTLYLIMVAP